MSDRGREFWEAVYLQTLSREVADEALATWIERWDPAPVPPPVPSTPEVVPPDDSPLAIANADVGSIVYFGGKRMRKGQCKMPTCNACDRLSYHLSPA